LFGRLAAQGGQCRGPLLRIHRLAGAEVDAERPEVGCARRLRRATEDIRSPGDLKVDKTGGQDRGLELCFQQSAGNSASPKIDLAFGAIGHRFLHQDVANL
jgi:hypothetical protein